ncbi:GH32 C-terminal domain-containing protein [Pseudomonas sp. CROZ-RG-20F-R04-06]|uniref:GH32 C-terminal domain-containing protein n=1 Tax=Pseudomonas sp. CROZ-RG-20F-R04-06 TaxID=2914833 RepID=UPI003221ECBE
MFNPEVLTALRMTQLPGTPWWGASGTRWVPEVNGDMLEIHVHLDLLGCTDGHLGVALRCSDDGREETLLYYDASLQRLVLDRSRSGAQVTGQRSVSIDPTQERLELRVFLDRSSIEVFDENGRFSLSSRLYPRSDSLGVKLLASGSGGRVSIAKAWPLGSAWS